MHAIVLQLFHEANAFLPERVSLADFQRRHYLAGEPVRQRFGASHNWMGGVLAGLDAAGASTTIGLCVAAHPGGMVDAASYAAIEADLLASLERALAAQPAGLVLLLLHGALVVEGLDDPEGRFCELVRQRVGRGVTLACTVDFHANLGMALLASADLVLGGLRYPHDDTFERGRRLVGLALDHQAAAGQVGKAARTWHFRLPLAVPMPAQHTMDEGPFAALVAWCQARTLEQGGAGLLDIGLLGGFPYTGSDLGCTSVLVTGTDYGLASAAFADLAALVWRQRAALLRAFPGPAQLRVLLDGLNQGAAGTLVLADVGDNPGAGGAGDDCSLLRLLIKQPYRFAFGILIAPRLALQAQAVGVGGTLRLPLQGAPRPDGTSVDGSGDGGADLWADAVVLRSAPLVYRNRGSMMTGELVDGGLGAVLRVGNGEVLVSSARIQAYDSEAFFSQGIDLAGQRVIAIKTSAHFRASYSALASAGIVLADSGGWASPDMRHFDHAARRRPILPLVPFDGAAWEASVQSEIQRNQGYASMNNRSGSEEYGPQALQKLERQLRRELDLLCLPAKPWVHPRSSDGQAVLDVLVVGAGMCGLSATVALGLLGITNVRLIDRAPAGAEGPWVTFARMLTLRSPKILAGPALGLPSLTFRAWYEANFGSAAWQALDKIPRPMWMDYLNWYRAVLHVAVDNDTHLTAITCRADGMLDVQLRGPQGSERVTARRAILANGRDGLGGAYVPPIANCIPPAYWAHSSAPIDFDALRGKRVAVIGAGASAMDNAATALENGAAGVDMFVRRPDIPRINKLTGITNPGLVHGFAGLADDWKWKLQAYSISTHPPPPRDSTLRVSRHANARFHVGSPILALRPAGAGAGGIALTTPKGEYRVDYIIFATGFSVDLALKPELAALAPHIKRWKDRYPAGAKGGPDELSEAPDLGPAFEFQSRDEPHAGLSSIHCFNYAAMLSHGKVSGDIPAVSTGAQRLASGIAERFFQEDIALHYQDMEHYDIAELRGDEWTDADAATGSAAA